MTSKQAAMLYLRDGTAYATSESRTEAGFWIAGSTCRQTAVDQLGSLAQLVLQALDESVDGIPTPPCRGAHRARNGPATGILRADLALSFARMPPTQRCSRRTASRHL